MVSKTPPFQIGCHTCVDACRRPFGVEQESIIPLFVDDEDLLPQLPFVGELLEKMFKGQKIRFTKVWETLFGMIILIHVCISTVYKYLM